MNAWINEIAELTGMSGTGIIFPLPDVSRLVPDTRFLWVVGIAALFALLA